MSLDEKVELVKAHRHRYGLNACLRAVGLSKGTWHYRIVSPVPSAMQP